MDTAPDRRFGHDTGYTDYRTGDVDCLVVSAGGGAPLPGAPGADAKYQVSGTLADDTTSNTFAKITSVVWDHVV